MGGASEVGVAHTAGHRNSTVDVAATSGSVYFSLLGSSVGCQQLVVRREGRRRCSVRGWKLIGGAEQVIGFLIESLSTSA